MKGVRRLFRIDIAMTENGVQMLKNHHLLSVCRWHCITYITFVTLLKCYGMLYKRKHVLKYQEVFPSTGIVKKEWICSFSEVVTVSVLTL